MGQLQDGSCVSREEAFYGKFREIHYSRFHDKKPIKLEIIRSEKVSCTAVKQKILCLSNDKPLYANKIRARCNFASA